MQISLLTSTGARSGTDARTVTVRLIGKATSTEPLPLRTDVRPPFGPGRSDRFTLEVPDDFDPLLVEVAVEGAPWYLDAIELEVGPRRSRFPCYAWIVTDAPRTLLPGAACLPGTQPPIVEAAREAELERRKEVYRWANADGLPAHVREQDPADLPLDERFTPARDASNTAHDLRTKDNARRAIGEALFDRWDDLDDDRLYQVLPVPALRDRWRDDAEFARQCLAGVAPTHIARTREIVPAIRAAASAVEAHLGEGLDEALAASRLYELDYGVIEGIPLFEGPGDERRYCPPSLCLLHQGDEGLRPVAIVLDRAPNATVFTPADGDRWQLAKVYVKCGEANLHQVVTHALLTHLAMEPFALATMRNLSSAHPLYKLLRRHLYGLLQINTEARQVLLGRGGVFDEFVATGGPERGHVLLAAKVYAGWTLADNELPTDLERRGVGQLRDYPYAEDARDLWDAIAAYVGDALGPFYPTAEAMAADPELAAWLDEARARARLGEGRGQTPKDLVRVVTTLIFTLSVQHAAVNFQQYEHFGFVPNAPAALRAPMPEGQPTPEDWNRALPGQPQRLRQLSVAWMLSRYAPDEQYLLPGPEGWRERFFEEPHQIAAIERFHAALDDVRRTIEARNHHRASPYGWLLPHNVPVSTAV